MINETVRADKVSDVVRQPWPVQSDSVEQRAGDERRERNAHDRAVACAACRGVNERLRTRLRRSGQFRAFAVNVRECLYCSERDVAGAIVRPP